mmetsp:Transcript_29895/g.68596  ORF Transcript_29895/g.68596 Transcript_29895/m.68596 type:complete len:84 (+) Transcript_29895:184-435(+)
MAIISKFGLHSENTKCEERSNRSFLKLRNVKGLQEETAAVANSSIVEKTEKLVDCARVVVINSLLVSWLDNNMFKRKEKAEYE